MDVLPADAELAHWVAHRRAAVAAAARLMEQEVAVPVAQSPDQGCAAAVAITRSTMELSKLHKRAGAGTRPAPTTIASGTPGGDQKKPSAFGL